MTEVGLSTICSEPLDCSPPAMGRTDTVTYDPNGRYYNSLTLLNF